MIRSGAAERWILLIVALLVTAAMVIAILVRAGMNTPKNLADLIDRADEVVVLQGPWDGAPLLFHSTYRRDLNALRDALPVDPPEDDTHCTCDGTPAIYLYANGRQIGLITNQHGKRIRCSLWQGDPLLPDPEALLKWFDDCSIAAPRREYEELMELERKREESKRKWLDAMPSVLKPSWPAIIRSPEPNLPPLRKLLAEQYPDKADRILALFAWHGAGGPSWTYYPGYEEITENLLLDYSTAELLAAIECQELSETQIEGVARLFAGWGLARLRLDDVKLLPAELKSRLLAHCLQSPDLHTRERAQAAFSEE